MSGSRGYHSCRTQNSIRFPLYDLSKSLRAMPAHTHTSTPAKLLTCVADNNNRFGKGGGGLGEKGGGGKVMGWGGWRGWRAGG